MRTVRRQASRIGCRGAGARVSRFLAAAGIASCAAAGPTSARACTIFVPGTDANCLAGNGSRVSDAVTHLTGRGYTVTNMPSYPASLAAYDAVWDPRCDTALSASEMTLLAAFVGSGKGAFFNSDYGSAGGRNVSLQTFLNNHLCAGSVSIQTTTAISPGGSPQQNVNMAAPGGLPTNPWPMAGMPMTPAGAASFLAYGTGLWLWDLDSAGVWHCGTMCGGGGKVVIVLDSNWMDLGTSFATANNQNFAHNIAEYLCSSCLPGSPTITRTPSTTPTASPTVTPLISFQLTLGTFTWSATATAPDTPTASDSPTACATATSTATPTAPGSPTGTTGATGAASASATSTRSASATTTNSGTAPPSASGTGPAADTATATATLPPSLPYFLLDRNTIPRGEAAAFRFSLAVPGRVQIRIFNSAGEHVRDLFDSEVPAGDPRVVAWDGRSEAGEPVSGNVYVARAVLPGTRKPRVFLVAVLP